MNHDDAIRGFVRDHNLNAHLNANLRRHLRLVQYPADHELFVPDDETAKLYFLVKGSAHVNYDHINGKRSIVGTLEPLALIGELDLFYDPGLDLTITTAESSTFLYLEQATALRYGADDPIFLRLVVYALSEKLTRSTVILKYNVLSLREQVTAYLLDQPTDDQGHIHLPSKTQLAELMGTTPRHLNRVLNAIIAEGLVTMTGNRVAIHDRERLS